MKYIIILLLCFISVKLYSQVKLIVYQGDTLYALTKTDFDKFYDILIDLDVCQKNDSLSKIQLKDRAEQIKYLRDSVGFAQHKIDSLNDKIIKNLTDATKPKFFDVKGLFAESNVIYMPIDTTTYFDLGINLKTVIGGSVELSPGIKGFYFKKKLSFGPFLRAEIKLY